MEINDVINEETALDYLNDLVISRAVNNKSDKEHLIYSELLVEELNYLIIEWTIRYSELFNVDKKTNFEIDEQIALAYLLKVIDKFKKKIDKPLQIESKKTKKDFLF